MRSAPPSCARSARAHSAYDRFSAVPRGQYESNLRAGLHIETLTVAGPFNPTRRGHAEPAADLLVPSTSRSGGRRARGRFCRRSRAAPIRRPVTSGRACAHVLRSGRAKGDFDDGIQVALQRLLASPKFVFRVEHDPSGARRARRIASAISSWRRGCRSSCGAAFPTTSCSTWPHAGQLSEPAVLERQVRRMLADPRSGRS